MKKTIAFVLLLALVSAFVAIPASAIPEGCTAVDITDQVKFASVVQTYKDRLPIVRADAELIAGNSHRTDSANYVAPGGGTRNITVTDFDQTNCMDMLQFDPFYNIDLAIDKDPLPGVWSYGGCVWANVPVDGDKNPIGKALLVYDFEVAEAGTYEFVFVGAAQIKPGDMNNDAKDRGFTYSIDGGSKYQVNVSDSPLVFNFDKYNYDYTTEQALTTKDFYQMGYVYGITAELTAGKHTLEFMHLEYSGDTVTDGSNNSRINLAGIFVQKYLDELALAAYEYPAFEMPAQSDTESEQGSQSEEPSESMTDEPESKEEPVNTNNTEAQTKKPEDPGTEKPKNEGGCKSAVISSVAVVVMACAAAVALKKH